MTIEALEDLLANGHDSALLRFGLGKGWLDAGDPARAATHLGRCVALDPQYSAAWKLLGKAWLAGGQPQAAREAWQRGLSVASHQGDEQARKEMQVFLRRLQREQPAPQESAG
ncbi:tetratricopeptide repeat protein [Stenotrophomonas sp. B2]|uniref:tetratricopeptide repeat protein n=1 Tax=Stenotrophomonas sp. B2 TaxID=1537778 RepID=UPI0018764BEF|nr:tetratricopeptide repeat protein [Stenotrophomonas sp. B2]MBE5269530.1 tetratricopeptide repeat protein [Stenotrophomonas sp. B2]MBH1834525.1 tetratricopeptide repeat protein [Stenotrophomonas maltophilia]